jgi:hypothetical protein
MEIEQERLREQHAHAERLRLAQSRTAEKRPLKPAKGGRK